MSALIPLPIEAIKTEFESAINTHDTLILSAPPGAGKSTCLPLWLLALSSLSGKKIYLLQPRRLAVKNIATFLAKQLCEKVGETVGYRLRNETSVSINTRLEVITEGILTQIIQQDPELVGVSLVVFDEFHERSLHGDLAFALCREVQAELRDDLKILLMSATLDSDYLMKALPDAVFLASEGRSFPVDISYQAPNNQRYWRDHALSVLKHQVATHQGSILVFLPGISDIGFLTDRLKESMPSNILLCPLYGNLTLAEQQKAIAPCENHQYKIVLATNIAETSLTIEGINLVIDCGLEKVALYDSASLLNKLVQKNIAKASAIQRTGRAGRVMAGHCIRLYAKDDFERRPQQSSNDIQQADLLPTLIEAARWGVHCLADLPLLELPSKVKEQQAWFELQSLSIIDKKNALTTHGELVAQLPCHPRFAHMLVSAKKLAENEQGKSSQTSTIMSLACLLTALLEERDIFRGEQARGDINIAHRLHLIIQHKNGQERRSAATNNIMKQALVLAKRFKQVISYTDLPIEKVGLLLAFAYPERVARARGAYGDFICANGKGAQVNDQDVMAQQEYLVFADIAEYKGKLSGRLAASITLLEIEQYFNDKIIEHNTAFYDEKTSRITQKKQTKLSSLVLSEQIVTQALNVADVSHMWCELLRKKGLDFLPWKANDLALISRWQWATRFLESLTLQSINDEFLLANLDVWFAPFVGEIKNKNQLAKLDLSAMLLSLLDYSQQQLLKQAAPSVYVGPTGRHCPITYGQEQSPKVSLPMQELYGLTQTPSIACFNDVNRGQGIPLLLELLSPAQRPIQLTQNLVQFWAGSYKAVQKDMKSNYPKHYWPDDPANAKPTNKVKRHMKS